MKRGVKTKTRVSGLLIPLLVLVAVFAVALSLHTGGMEGKTTLLTYIEETGQGGTASVHLEVTSGNGRVFIDSFPLTRLDTQSSTRYANRIACEFIDEDCSRYDFFYTIRADSAIVGGPSAGGAIAVLTVAVLDGQEMRSDVGMTGTINSGGIIGPVAGVPEKLEGAKREGLSTVLIPSLTTNKSNLTTEVEVIEVSSLSQALEVYTGKRYSTDFSPPVPPEEYTSRMREVADLICERMESLYDEMDEIGEEFNDTGNFSQRLSALPEGRDYSRASLCFSTNIVLATQLREQESVSELQSRTERLERATVRLNEKLSKINITTVSDLEVYSIVKERVIEAEMTLRDVNMSDPDPGAVGFIEERLVSATTWSKFFGMPSKQIIIDDVYLTNACLEKISEAEERIGYLRLYSDSLAVNAKTTLSEAYRYKDDEPAICLFIASKARAEADVVASALAVTDEGAFDLVDVKLDVAAQVISQKQSNDFFPILGYSYYQYAQDLGENYKYSALNFAEYSIELSNVDMYFPEKNGLRIPPGFWEAMTFFAFGALFGLGLAGFILIRNRP